MIHIHPETDLREHIIVTASKILDYLYKKDNESFVDNCLAALLKNKTIDNPNDFFDALCFLFVFNFIKYENFKIKVTNATN